MSRVSFERLKPIEQSDSPRLSAIRSKSGAEIFTPNYIGLSSRGCIPHLTPDMMRSETAIKGIYTAFEDYAEHLPDPPPLYDFPCGPSESPLRRFVVLQDDKLLVLGPRRLPAVHSTSQNTPTSMNICTAVGYRTLEIVDYIRAAKRMRPDIMIAPVDIDHTNSQAGRRRMEKMAERSVAWVRGLQAEIERTKEEGGDVSAIWVPILPIEAEQQRSYLEHLEEGGAAAFDGIALYDDRSVLDIPGNMLELPRLSVSQLQNPHRVLTAVSLGIDLFALPFISAASEAGIAFTFRFPAPAATAERLVLGFDLWSPEHAADVRPLQEGCTCYTCRKHHRAFVQHLLSTKEMLAWVLLQLHNHRVIEHFFSSIRSSVTDGLFERDVEDFAKAYQDQFPEFKGEGPRIRGYQSQSLKGQTPKKLNKAAYQKLEDATASESTSSKPKKNTAALLDDRVDREAESREAGLLDNVGDAGDLEGMGFGRLYEEH